MVAGAYARISDQRPVMVLNVPFIPRIRPPSPGILSGRSYGNRAAAEIRQIAVRIFCVFLAPEEDRLTGQSAGKRSSGLQGRCRKARGSLARYREWLFWHCTRGEFKLHRSSCAVVSAGVVAPVDVVRHCRHRRLSNRYFGRNCEGVREFPGISHGSRCVDYFGAAFIGDTYLNLGIGAVSGVTVRPRCCNCHRISRFGACRTYRIGRGKTRRLAVRR